MLETKPAELEKCFDIKLLNAPVKLSIHLQNRVDIPTTMQKLSELSVILGREFLSQVLTAWMESAKERLASMLAKAAENHHVFVGKTAHALQGSSLLLGFDKLAGMCQKVENATNRFNPRYKRFMYKIRNEINNLTLMVTNLVHFLGGEPAQCP